jgi:hypothetical protein
MSHFGLMLSLELLNLHKIGNAHNPYKYHVIKFEVLLLIVK